MFGILATLVDLATTPTTYLVIAVAVLLVEIYRRTFIDCYGDDCKTIGYIPFWHWPDPTRLTKNIRNELDYLVKYGQVVRFVNFFGPSQRMFIISDPEVMREIYLGKHWQDFDRAHHTLELAQLFAGGLILIPNGPKWKEARDLFGRTFTNVTIRTYYPILRHNLDVLMEEIGKKAKSGESFNAQRVFTNYTFDTIARLTFGEDLDTQRGGPNTKYVEAWENLLQYSGLSILVTRSLGKSILGLTGLPQKCLDNAATIHQIVLRNIERRKRGEDLDRFSIFDDAMGSGKVPEWMLENDNKELLKQLMTFLFAGHDTTASMLSFMIGELATRPEWQQKIRQEVVEAFGDGETSLEKLEGMKNLNAVMKETLRLYPAAPHGGQRVALHDFDFTWTDTRTGQPRTVHFKEGDLILPSVYITAHHPENWTNPETFAPERWLEDPNGGAQHLFSWVPFGNGPRKCLGERLALNEGRLVVAELLRAYKVLPDPNWKLDINQAGMLIPNGINIRLVPVKH